MDLSTLRTRLRTRLGVPSSDPLYSDTVCTALINEANHLIEADYDWPWLETSESFAALSTETKAPAADWLRTLYVQQGDYPALKRVPVEELREMPSPSGRPFFYAHDAGVLRFRPVPNGVTLTHGYIKQEPDLSGSTDEPLMPKSYRPAIVTVAASLAFRRAGQLAEAQRAEAEYEVWRERMMRRHSRESPSEGGGVEPKAAP